MVLHRAIDTREQGQVRRPPREMVGIRQKPTLGILSLVSQACHEFVHANAIQSMHDVIPCLDQRQHLLECLAFDQGDHMLNHFAAGQFPEQALRRHAGGDLILASLQAVRKIHLTTQPDQIVGVSGDSPPLQVIRQLPQ